MKTAATNKKVRELVNMVREGKLLPRPEFQRRLVWTQKDKDRFLDTVLKNLPFPEIYLADGDVDLETGAGTQLLVDGLQRVYTLLQYFEGDPELRLPTVPPYHDLDETQKKAYLQYDVAVRDLGSLSRDMIVEVFQRINATKYSLNDIEINNAIYDGALKKYASTIAEHPFFSTHGVFTATDYKRMGDLRFAIGLICTMLRGYFNRDDAFEEMLSRYNDDFSESGLLSDRLGASFGFVEECGFQNASRAWKKADLFTLIVEVDRRIRAAGSPPQPQFVVETIGGFYVKVDAANPDGNDVASQYYKAALQASNDRINRVRRGIVIGGLLAAKPESLILHELVNAKAS